MTRIANLESAEGIIMTGKDIAAGYAKDLIEIERKLWTNDPIFYKNNLAEDCLLVFAETGVYQRHSR